MEAYLPKTKIFCYCCQRDPLRLVETMLLLSSGSFGFSSLYQRERKREKGVCGDMKCLKEFVSNNKYRSLFYIAFFFFIV